MKMVKYISVGVGLGMVAMTGFAQQPMSFFITSEGPGDGGNLGGLAGADAHCQQLAAAAGHGDATWRAYLSQAAGGGAAAVNARDRIGNGPWYNANGAYIAWDVDGLHEDRNNIRKPTAVDENGNEIAGAGDSPNRHDILTGSNSAGNLPDGGFVPGGGPGFTTTCSNWTSGDAGNAVVGHHDRLGGPSASWNAVHSTRSCSQSDLESTGGDGLFYCFAAD
tara:strand:+ start:311 stop:973 length:663 start_codon:yes stop_codon:yes gene_type:complete